MDEARAYIESRINAKMSAYDPYNEITKRELPEMYISGGNTSVTFDDMDKIMDQYR